MIDIGNPNGLTLAELASIGLCFGTFVVCLIATTRQAFLPKDRLFKRVFWVGCGFLMWAGTVGLVYFAAFPPERFDKAGRLIGEMPFEFGLAGTLVELSLCAAIVGFVVKAFTRDQKPRQERGPDEERPGVRGDR